MQVNPAVFKAYDIRGIYPTTINEDFAYKLGLAYAAYIKPTKEILVGADVRIYSGVLKENLIKGLIDAGVNVVDVGTISTDMYYFGVGNFGFGGGIQVTASHNPKEWHGFKMVKEGPVAISYKDGISQIQQLMNQSLAISPIKGKFREQNILEDFSENILSWLKDIKLKPMKVVINPNFGLAGQIFEHIVKKGELPIEIIGINTIPDGNFPKGRPDPYIPENRIELCDLVKSSHADLGITWDADADRVFFIDEHGQFIDPYYVNTTLIKVMLSKYPASNIVYEPRYQWGTLDVIKENGGSPVVCQVGHSYIKQKMREADAIFASESSGHTYYRDFWYADCGMIPAMQMLTYLSKSNETLSETMKPIMNKYFISGEINTEIVDKDGKMNQISEIYKDAKQSRLDGVSIEYDDWRFCVRPSNTEPLLRLTLEARSKSLMEQKRDEVLHIIKS